MDHKGGGSWNTRPERARSARCAPLQGARNAEPGLSARGSTAGIMLPHVYRLVASRSSSQAAKLDKEELVMKSQGMRTIAIVTVVSALGGSAMSRQRWVGMGRVQV